MLPDPKQGEGRRGGGGGGVKRSAPTSAPTDVSGTVTSTMPANLPAGSSAYLTALPVPAMPGDDLGDGVDQARLVIADHRQH